MDMRLGDVYEGPFPLDERILQRFQPKGPFTALGVYGSLAAAEPISAITTTNTVVSCSYEFVSGGVAPTPIPTIDEYVTTSTTITHGVTVPSTVNVTASSTATVTEVTATELVVGSPTVTIPTSTKYVGQSITVATAVFAETVCDHDAKPVIVTKYTGTYAPLSGQATTVPTAYPTQAHCTTTLVESVDLFATHTSGVVTNMVTPSSTVPNPTTTTTKAVIFNTVTEHLTTVTQTQTLYTPVSVGTTSTLSCANTVTKTLDARCAPTNLISAINGEGILSGDYADRVVIIDSVDGLTAKDPSLCCQTCLDNEGCGASEASDEGCSLYYAPAKDGETVCDAFIFSFTSDPEVPAGQGLIVQSGCDRVEYKSSA
ncbi:hypothetical protein GGS21DRAFT_541931 [Xylaria nigripes]|nr:hypothetical protein GGS21DRAFT_541931 [Xylaria nigripes]